MTSTESGLAVPAYVRGGFFCGDTDERAAALAENKSIIDEAAQIGAQMVVLVCGAKPGLALSEARDQIAAGIETLLPYAEQMKVKLAIEPLHPMYAADRSAINTMGQARQLCRMLPSPYLGIALDVYHTWWDPDLYREIELAGEMNTLFALHVCDWKQHTADLLNDRGLMGEGVIDISGIRHACQDAGFAGLVEVEIFSNRWWGHDQDDYLTAICGAFEERA